MKIFKQRSCDLNRSKSELSFTLLFLTIWSPTTVSYIAVFFEKITGVELLKVLFPPVLCVVLILTSFNYWVKHIRGTDVLIYLIIVILCLLNYWLDDTNIEVQRHYLPMFIKAYLLMFVGIAINLKTLKQPLYYMSFLNILLASFYYLIFTQASLYSGNLESMADNETAHIGDVAYQILPSVLYIIWYTFDSFKLINWSTIINVVCALVGFILISAFGTRGPLVCIIFFLILYMFFFSNQKNVVRFLLLILGVVCYFFIEPLLFMMASLMQSLGMSSRIFTYAIEGTFLAGEASTDERALLIQEAQRALNANDLSTYFGNGFLGWSKCMSNYPHNFYYDVMISFGYILGSLFLVALTILFFKAIKAKVPNDWKCIALVVSMVGFIQLFMSGTFWSVSYFYLLIGLCLNIIRSKPELGTVKTYRL